MQTSVVQSSISSYERVEVVSRRGWKECKRESLINEMRDDGTKYLPHLSSVQDLCLANQRNHPDLYKISGTWLSLNHKVIIVLVVPLLTFSKPLWSDLDYERLMWTFYGTQLGIRRNYDMSMCHIISYQCVIMQLGAITHQRTDHNLTKFLSVLRKLTKTHIRRSKVSE